MSQPKQKRKLWSSESMKAAIKSVKGDKGLREASRHGSTTFQLKLYEDVLLEWLTWIVDQAPHTHLLGFTLYLKLSVSEIFKTNSWSVCLQSELNPLPW